ncbi:GNAT family N-acetyltransferase [Anderseniella sp. Alg231-50]|uniref:GNAT family N-acetyltransferase n=1 Tax=Anderseniella sp. Alg231-50 TaxID=1922226 RepID=UPI000D54AF50
MSITIREAKPGDGPVLHRLVRELADHHGELDRVVSTPDALEAGLCSSSDRHGCLIAECDGEPVGFVYWYEIFTTFTAKPKLYMEDICVSKQARGTGAGFALVRALAEICMERGCPRFEWLAMEDNDAGRKFYSQIGATVLRGADTWQLWDADISALAEDR